MNDTATLFDILSADLRRRLLFLLCDSPELDVPDALRPRSQAAPKPGQFATGDGQGDTLRIQLYHVHLPKLDDQRLVEWDRDAQTVSRGPRFDEVEPVLRLLAENSERFPDDLL
jgi:hypothetical protein